MASPVGVGAEDVVAVAAAGVDGVALVVGNFDFGEEAYVHVLLQQGVAGKLELVLAPISNVIGSNIEP